MTRLSSQPWMTAPETVKLMAALGEARFVGGAVRNALLGLSVADVDVATPLTPDKVQARLAAAGIAAVPTGIAHGTVTAVVDGKPFEVTTLRRDVETFGRHATVAFSESWEEDAARRDFTINALYASAEGEVFDYFGGIDDLAAGRVRFVGDATTRIREDYLRILRLFRFHAWYGKGALDAEALRAAAAEKAGLAQLSGERIAKEMLRLLAADDPAPVLNAMAASGILSEILPGEAKLARLEKLARIDAANFFVPDALLRLAALLPEGADAAIAERWKLSNAQRERLAAALVDRKLVPYLSVREARKLLYRIGAAAFKDAVRLAWADDPKTSNTAHWRALLALADAFVRPRFPLGGREVMLAGVPEGPLIGRVLAEVEEWWIEADFTNDELALAERLQAVVRAVT
jgi:poly(A) polymerase